MPKNAFINPYIQGCLKEVQPGDDCLQWILSGQEEYYILESMHEVSKICGAVYHKPIHLS